MFEGGQAQYVQETIRGEGGAGGGETDGAGPTDGAAGEEEGETIEGEYKEV